MWNNVSSAEFFEQPNEVQNAGAKKNKSQNAVPVFVRSVLNNYGEEMNMFGIPIKVVELMGVLKEYDVQSTKATYDVEDHTGRITCLYWIDSEGEENQNLPMVKIGTYVRVIGKPRSNEGKIQIMVLSMDAVESLNAVTTFGLEVIHSRLEFEAGCTPTAYIHANNPSADLANSMISMNTEHCAYGMNSLQAQVLDIIKDAKGPEGAYRNDILKKFPPTQHKEINGVLLYLTEEGLAFTTTSPDLFKSTESM